MTGEEAAKRLFKQVVKAIHDGKDIFLSDPMIINAKTLAEMAQQIVGDEFLASVDKAANGFDRIKRFHSLINPGKIKVPMDAVVADFQID